MKSGTVYLVGAGPGDPGLLTVRGLELLRMADVIVYDRLAHPALLGHTRPDAERIYVGKASAHHAMKQEEINALLVARASQNLQVVRLKGGDPFVFGRGGEEAEACQSAGVRFEVVPGVTSAIAAAAYAGIPITHRDAASSFAVVTGHERDDSGEASTRTAGQAEGRRRWETLAHAADTLVFLMGVEALPEIALRLQEQGRDPETPVALVQWGTWSKQRVVTGTLRTITAAVRAAGITPPAVCIVGDVVRLRERLQWFDAPGTCPLFGKRVLVTRAREQASALSNLLRSRGADPIEFPVIRIDPIEPNASLDSALSKLKAYDWVVFTSANTVPILDRHLTVIGSDVRAFSACKIAAIGSVTAATVFETLRLNPDLVPTEAIAEQIIAEWPEEDLTGQRILIPNAAEARDILPDALRKRGATVDVIPVYTTRFDGPAAEDLKASLTNGEIDVLTFTSSSTVRNFAQALGEPKDTLQAWVGNACVAAIGPITAETAREYGLIPSLVAEEHTVIGLVEAMERYFHA